MSKLKVLVAEDERLIREGIVHSIGWDNLEAEVSGQAKNGREALKKLKEVRPDILLTDIKMGGGDGLELIREAKILCPDLRVIIISGYNSFEYAQRAIQLGVQDYILKPIRIEELETILTKVIGEIRREESRKEDREKQEEVQRKSRQILIDEFYRELIYGVIDQENIRHKVRDFDVATDRRSYFCVLLFIELRNNLKWPGLQKQLWESMKEFCRGQNLEVESILFSPNDLYHTDMTVIFSSGETYFQGRDLPADLKRITGTISDLTLLAMGVGPVVSRFEEFPFSYQKGRTQAYFALVSGLNSKKDSPLGTNPEIPLSLFETTRKLYTIFNHGSQHELDDFLGEIEGVLQSDEMPEERKTDLIRNLLVCILSAGDELGIALRNLFPDLMVLFRYINLNSVEDMYQKMRWACESILSQQQTREEKNGIDLMEKAKSIIIKNYTDPLLSLESISRDLSITPAYFSKLYKKFHGVSYIEFLTDLRLKRAVEYLEGDRSIKISAVAYKVGYNSSSYFNYIFKKYYEMTPREFQRKG